MRRELRRPLERARRDLQVLVVQRTETETQPRVGVGGGELGRMLEGAARLGESPRRPQHPTEVDVGIGERGVERDRPLERFARGVELLGHLEREPATVVQRRQLRRDLDESPEGHQRRPRVVLIEREVRVQEQGARMLRIRPQRFVQVDLGLMVPHVRPRDRSGDDAKIRRPTVLMPRLGDGTFGEDQIARLQVGQRLGERAQAIEVFRAELDRLVDRHHGFGGFDVGELGSLFDRGVEQCTRSRLGLLGPVRPPEDPDGRDGGGSECDPQDEPEGTTAASRIAVHDWSYEAAIQRSRKWHNRRLVSHPLLGKRLAGKYELIALAGEGGMAEVFRAVTHGVAGFRRPVAIKRVLEHLSEDQEFLDMFVEEARVMAALQHPNIVQIHDFDKDEEGAYFLVMEWIEGLNHLDWLRSYLSRGEPTPWHLVAAIGIEVLKGLSGAHENQDDEGNIVPVFHRDVTPQNILMGNNGVIRLTDFGLARAMDRARMTRPQMVKGKLSYLAPELTGGADATPQTDIFGVGVVLWEALANRKLFDGDGPLNILTKISECEVPPLTEERPDIPRKLHDTVHRALSKDPEKRFRSARSMVRALANILRMTPESTSAEVLAQSVRSAREELDRRKKRGPRTTEDLEVDDLEEVADQPSEGHFPLTRRKE